MNVQQKYFQDVLSDCLSGEIRENYSGRGMFRKTCPAMLYQSEKKAFSDFIDFVAQIDDAEERQLASSILKNVCVDSMERETVIYFPRLAMEEGC